MKLEFFKHIFKKKNILKYKISRKSTQWEPSCSMRTDGRTDGRTEMAKLIASFQNFTNAPERNNIFQLLLALATKIVPIKTDPHIK